MKNTNIKAKAHLVKFSDNVLLKDLILFAKEQRDIEWLESLFTGNQFEVDNLHEFIEFLERQTILLNKELGDEPFSLFYIQTENTRDFSHEMNRNMTINQMNN